MNPQTIIPTAIFLVVAAIIMSTVTWEVEEVETYYADEPYTYKQELVREKQVPNLPWFWQEVTQTQYLVKNTDVKDGTFVLNFLFDDGSDTKTRTEKVTILSGEEKAVTMNSPLLGVSIVSLSVVPPNKRVPQQRTVKKTVNAWDYFPGLKYLLGKKNR